MTEGRHSVAKQLAADWTARECRRIDKRDTDVIAAVVETAHLLQDPIPVLVIACNVLEEEYRLTITGYTGMTDLVAMARAFRAETRSQAMQPVRQVCYNERAKAYIVVIERGELPMVSTKRNGHQRRYLPQLEMQTQQTHHTDMDAIDRAMKARDFARLRMQTIECVVQADIPYVLAVLEAVAGVECPIPPDMVVSCVVLPTSYRILFSGYTKLVDLVIMVNTFLGVGRSVDLHSVELLFRHEDDNFWVIEMQKTEQQTATTSARHQRRKGREY